MTRPSLRHALAALGVVPMACSAPAPAQRGRSADHSAPAENQMSAGGNTAGSSREYPLDPSADPSTTTTEAPATTAVTIVLPDSTTTTVRARPLPVTTLPERANDEMSDTEWLIRQTFPESPDRAVRIARCESGLDPHATNGQYVGIMQVATAVHAKLIAAMGFTVADLYGVTANLAVARAIYDAAGDWSPWTCAA